MGFVASILPFVAGGLGFLVILLLIVLSVLIFLMLRNDSPDWEDADVIAAREAPAVRSIPNSKAHWRAASDPAWKDPAAAEAIAGKLVSLGFQKAGAFTHSGKDLAIVLYAIPEHHVAGWIQENGDGEIDLTVCSWDETGAPIRVSSVKSESSFVLLDGERRQISGRRSPEDLCRQLVELREGLALCPVAVETVVRLLNREERQRARRLTQDTETADIWGRHLLKAEVKNGETGGRISGKALQSVFLSQLGDTITDCCLESFAEMSQISAVEWVRVHERFLVIHDRLSAAELKDLEVCEALSNAERRKIKPLLRKEIPAREAFAAMNAELPAHLRFTEVGRVSDPVEATVYLAS